MASLPTSPQSPCDASSSVAAPVPRHHFVFNTLRTVEKGQFIKMFSAEILEMVMEEQLKKASNPGSASSGSTPLSVFPSAPAPQLSGEIGVVEDVTYFTTGELRRLDNDDDRDQQHPSPSSHVMGADSWMNTPPPQQLGGFPHNRRGGARHQHLGYNSVFHTASHAYNNSGGHSQRYKAIPQNYHHSQHCQRPINGVASRAPLSNQDASVLTELVKSVAVKARSGFTVEVPLDTVRRAYLVVLDLNGILGARDKGLFVPRPNLHAFLKFIFEHFLVAVWTSGVQKNADVIIKDLFGPDRNHGVDYSKRLLFCWYRDKTTPNPTPDKPHGTIKDLSKIFDAFPASFHAANTIIVDDSPEKCTHPSISLCPTAFTEDDARVWQARVAQEGTGTSIANTPVYLGASSSGQLKKQLSASAGFPTSPQQHKQQHDGCRQSSFHMASTDKYVQSDDSEQRGLQYVQRVMERVLVEDNLHAVYEAAEERLEEAVRRQTDAKKDSTPHSLVQTESTIEALRRLMQDTRARKEKAASFPTVAPPQPLGVEVPAAVGSAALHTGNHDDVPNTHAQPSARGLPVHGNDDDEDDEFYYSQMVVE